MEQGEYSAKLIYLSSPGISNEEWRRVNAELRAEFDRIMEIIKNQSKLILNMGQRGARLQDEVDKICEPMKQVESHILPSNLPNNISQAVVCRAFNYMRLQERGQLSYQNEKICDLCGKPLGEGETNPHKECVDREKFLADRR